jgi:hypothetical protein
MEDLDRELEEAQQQHPGWDVGKPEEDIDEPTD